MSDARIQMLRKFISDEPNNPFNTYALAMEYYERQPDQSLTLLQQLLEDHHDYLPTYFKAAHLYWNLEEWEQAESIFEKGIQLAENQQDEKAKKELKAAFQNFQIDMDPT
jgi:tetratricopeptide (TPR) repeat protein